MPKIFLLKNRLQEQQARLLESQKGGNEQQQPGGLDELGDKPVALIVNKSDTSSLKDNSPTGTSLFHSPLPPLSPSFYLSLPSFIISLGYSPSPDQFRSLHSRWFHIALNSHRSLLRSTVHLQILWRSDTLGHFQTDASKYVFMVSILSWLIHPVWWLFVVSMHSFSFDKCLRLLI